MNIFYILLGKCQLKKNCFGNIIVRWPTIVIYWILNSSFFFTNRTLCKTRSLKVLSYIILLSFVFLKYFFRLFYFNFIKIFKKIFLTVISILSEHIAWPARQRTAHIWLPFRIKCSILVNISVRTRFVRISLKLYDICQGL